MNKTFEATNGTARKLLVTRLNDNLHFIVEDDDSRELGVVLHPETAAGIMLAVAENAGVVPTPANERKWGESIPGFPSHLRDIAGMLADQVAMDAERVAKEAADMAAFEAEAWELWRAFHPESRYESFGELSATYQRDFLNIARRAREIHGVTK